MSIKSYARIAAQSLKTALRKFRGVQRVELYGFECLFSSDSELPALHTRTSPRSGYLDDIVRYTDTVQVHSAVRHLLELDHSPAIMDIGAFHGFYAILLGKIAAERKGILIAVEPNARSFDILSRNVELNGLRDTIRCCRTAVGAIRSSVRISADSSESHVQNNASGSNDKVGMTTLSDLLAQHGQTRADLLIVDVEGMELPVLKGWPVTQSLPDFTLCELHASEWAQYGYGSRDWFAFMTEHHLVAMDAYWRILNECSLGSKYAGPVRLMNVKGMA